MTTRRTEVEASTAGPSKSRSTDTPSDALPGGLSAPARRALAGAGIHTLGDLAARSEAEVLRLHGMGPKAMGVLRQALADRGTSFADGGR